MCIFNTFTAKIEYVLFSTQYSEKNPLKRFECKCYVFETLNGNSE